MVSIWRNLWCLSAGQKSSSSLMFSLGYCTDIAKLLFWVLRVCLTTQTKVILSTCRYLFSLSVGEKTTSSSMFFGDIAKICNNFLFCVLWACLALHTQNYTIDLKTLMFICIVKIHFIIHFLLVILHFKESCNLICWQHFDP